MIGLNVLKDLFHRPLKDLRISVTDRCNFRCPYCMPVEVFGEKYEFLPRGEILTFEEIERLAGLFVHLGASKMRITGGEPLLRQQLERLVRRLAGLEGMKDLTLTTNGYLLAEKSGALKEAGLHRITVSLDSLNDATFRQMNGLGFRVEKVLEGISEAEAVGFHPIKVNVVVQRGINDGGVVDIARHFHGTGHIIRFIEFMDVGTLNQWELAQVVPGAEILERIGREMALEPAEPNYVGEVARRYRYRDGGGEIGIITSVTQPFCGDCTRVRLSTDGKIYTCLFAGKATDLRDSLRSGATDEDLLELISSTWKTREDRYSELRTGQTPGYEASRKIEMYQIGG